MDGPIQSLGFVWLWIGGLQAVKAMVQQAAQYLDDVPDMDTRNELIETLNSVSFGKVPTKFLSSRFWLEGFIVYPRMPMELGIIIVSLKLVSATCVLWWGNTCKACSE